MPCPRNHAESVFADKSDLIFSSALQMQSGVTPLTCEYVQMDASVNCTSAGLAGLAADGMSCLQVGVTEGKLRKWLLSVTAFLANQNGSIAEAIALWQRNVQKEFEGVEECLICYSIVSASDGKLPKMHCRTCSKRFHGSCLYKWFQSSGKSNCPHCQSPW